MARTRIRNQKNRKSKGPLAVVKEGIALQRAWMRFSLLHLPREIVGRVISAPSLTQPWSSASLRESFSRAQIQLFDDLGPIYGKSAQIILQRLGEESRGAIAQFGLEKLFAEWHPLPFSEITAILDEELPNWRSELTVETSPLGVASMAQVHAATNREGRALVVKVLKPNSQKRVEATSAAGKSLIDMAFPLAKFSPSTRRLLKDLQSLLIGFEQEANFRVEREILEKARERLQKGSSGTLRLPELVDSLCTSRILVMERFEGPRLSDIMAGRVSIPPETRKHLARKLLKELLVQVFEAGLFHGDPHGGNLILLSDGSVGLFDWGLAGELTEEDRRHIAAILRSAISLDMDGLLDALMSMAESGGKTINRERLRKILQKLSKDLASGEEKPSLRRFLQLALDASDKLDLPIPTGLILMAKSLMTIEGLAKGLDPQVAMLRIATPVLLRAAKPNLRDLLAFGAKIPAMMSKYMGRE